MKSRQQRSIGLIRADEPIEQSEQLRCVRDLLEAEDRCGEFLECFFINLEPIGDGQDEPGRAIAGQKPRQPFQARAFPEAQHLKEHVISRWCVHQPVIGHPDALSSQLEDVGALADLPVGRDLAKPVDKRFELDRSKRADVGLV